MAATNTQMKSQGLSLRRRRLKVPYLVILVCSGVSCAHQRGHHPFGRWRDNNPQVWLAASHSHVPSRGRWRLGGHDFTQAVAAGCAEDARGAPGVNIAVPCRGAQRQKHIIKPRTVTDNTPSHQGEFSRSVVFPAAARSVKCFQPSGKF